MDIAADLALFRAERDALAFLGLLSSLYLRFDPPISPANGTAAQPTHFQGLNIHALVIDNADGEVLALEHNQIHAHQSPVEHAEQRALRIAIAPIRFGDLLFMRPQRGERASTQAYANLR